MKYLWKSVTKNLVRNIVCFVLIFFLVGWYRSGQPEISFLKAVFTTAVIISTTTGIRVLVGSWELGRKAKRLLVSKDEVGFARYVLKYPVQKFYSPTFKEDLNRDIENAIQEMKRQKEKNERIVS